MVKNSFPVRIRKGREKSRRKIVVDFNGFSGLFDACLRNMECISTTTLAIALIFQVVGQVSMSDYSVWSESRYSDRHVPAEPCGLVNRLLFTQFHDDMIVFSANIYTYEGLLLQQVFYYRERRWWKDCFHFCISSNIRCRHYQRVLFPVSGILQSHRFIILIQKTAEEDRRH